MTIATEDRERLARAVRSAMQTARIQKTAVPVREVAQNIIAETQSDPVLLDEVLDAVCALCVRSGLIIEFTRPVGEIRAA